MNMTDWDKELDDVKKIRDDAVEKFDKIEQIAEQYHITDKASFYKQLLDAKTEAIRAYNLVFAKREAEQQAQRIAPPGMTLRI